jgi:hypothetical protein
MAKGAKKIIRKPQRRNKAVLGVYWPPLFLFFHAYPMFFVFFWAAFCCCVLVGVVSFLRNAYIFVITVL